MSSRTESLDILAQGLGYPTEKEMLEDYYLAKKMSTTAIAKDLGVRSQSNIRLRLMRHGVELRKKGGYMGRKEKKETT